MQKSLCVQLLLEGNYNHTRAMAELRYGDAVLRSHLRSPKVQFH